MKRAVLKRKYLKDVIEYLSHNIAIRLPTHQFIRFLIDSTASCYHQCKCDCYILYGQIIHIWGAKTCPAKITRIFRKLQIGFMEYGATRD